jgi:hypothetical protein
MPVNRKLVPNSLVALVLFLRYPEIKLNGKRDNAFIAVLERAHTLLQSSAAVRHSLAFYLYNFFICLVSLLIRWIHLFFLSFCGTMPSKFGRSVGRFLHHSRSIPTDTTSLQDSTEIQPSPSLSCYEMTLKNQDMGLEVVGEVSDEVSAEKDKVEQHSAPSVFSETLNVSDEATGRDDEPKPEAAQSATNEKLKASDEVCAGDEEPKPEADTNVQLNNPMVLKSKRSISFHEIEIREYERILGDNPGTPHGPSLSIGWLYSTIEKVPVDVYEKTRPSWQRRTVSALQVPSTEREALLRQHTDCTKQDIAAACHAVRLARFQRSNSVAMREVEHYVVLWESVQRKMARFLKKRPSTQREMELLWEQAGKASLEKTKPDLVTRNAIPEGIHSLPYPDQEKPDSSNDDSEEEDIQLAVALTDASKSTKTTPSTTTTKKNCHTKNHRRKRNIPKNKNSFVVVGEDGTMIIDPASMSSKSKRKSLSDSGRTVSTCDMSHNFTTEATSSNLDGQVILVKKREKKPFFSFGSSSKKTNAPRLVRQVGTTNSSSCSGSPGFVVEC